MRASSVAAPAELTRLAQILGDIADAWGFTVAGDDRVELRFAREVDLSQLDRVIEFSPSTCGVRRRARTRLP